MSNSRKHYFVDLFAGCGGMSLGLEEAGFTPLLFSELNKSAADSYMVNRQDEYEFIELKEAIKTSRSSKVKTKKKHLIKASDIKELTLSRLKKINRKWNDAKIDLDLVCGGPPCQGFSRIGHKRTNTKFNTDRHLIESNHLYHKMILVIRNLRPKIFLFENVAGILSSKWKANDKRTVFKDVFRDFKSILNDYKIRWELVKSWEFGVPQNRPRVLMVGIRNNVDFLNKENQVGWDEINKATGFPKPSAKKYKFIPDQSNRKYPDIASLLGDLMESEYPNDPEKNVNDFIKNNSPNARPYPKKASKLPSDIRLWFRKKGRKTLTSVEDHEYSRHRKNTKKKFNDMIYQGKGHGTKKFSQRVLPAKWKKSRPMFTVTSLPDDVVHYSQPRILTVREWARLQTFPDWYKFCGPRTTGGKRRAGDMNNGDFTREVPHYTQIGNAVPVWLAEALGKHFRSKILK